MVKKAVKRYCSNNLKDDDYESEEINSGSDLDSFLMIYRNGSVEFGRFLHCGFRNPLAVIWAVS